MVSPKHNHRDFSELINNIAKFGFSHVFLNLLTTVVNPVYWFYKFLKLFWFFFFFFLVGVGGQNVFVKEEKVNLLYNKI